MEEVWRPVVGFEGVYEVSNYGRVRSIDRYVNHSTRGKTSFRKGQILRSGIRAGYPSVVLSKEGVHKNFLIHRLVAFAFPEICGKWFEGCQINHKDECKTNDMAINLEVCTCAYNNKYGSKGKKTSEKLTNGPLSKPIIQYDLEGRIVREWPSFMELYREKGYTRSVIYNCCLKGWKGYGYKWKYATQ